MKYKKYLMKVVERKRQPFTVNGPKRTQEISTVVTSDDDYLVSTSMCIRFVPLRPSYTSRIS